MSTPDRRRDRRHPLLSGMGRSFLAVAAALCLLVNAVGWTLVHRLDRDVSSLPGLDIGHDSADGAVDILLVGTDNRTDAQGNPLSQSEIDMLRAGQETSENTDTILLIRIPNDGSSATAISIPRDTYVQTSAQGKIKINGVYSATKDELVAKDKKASGKDAVTPDQQRDAVQAGRNALIGAVKDLTGVEVDHYAEIGLLGFVLLTNAVGGVPVCLKEDVDEPLSGAKFHAGQQTISGADALSFVRQRHDLPAGDLDRIVRQQVFMAQLTKKILSTGTLTDPSKLSKLSQAAGRSFVLDENWDITDFAMKLKDLSGGAVKFETIPVVNPDGQGEYGESVIIVDRKKVQEFVRQHGGVSAPPPSPTVAAPSTAGGYGVDPAKVRVEVVNATQREGLAATVAKALETAGFAKATAATDARSAVTSHVSGPTAGDPGAFAVAQKLGGLPVQVDPDLADGTVRVVLAEDYAGLAAEAAASLTPETSAMDAATTTPELPPSIAHRPVFDAGGSSVPCVN